MVNLSFWSKCIVFLMKVHQNHAVFQPLFFRMTFRRGHVVRWQHLTHCHSGDAECSRRRGENGRWLRNRVQGQRRSVVQGTPTRPHSGGPTASRLPPPGGPAAPPQPLQAPPVPAASSGPSGRGFSHPPQTARAGPCREILTRILCVPERSWKGAGCLSASVSPSSQNREMPARTSG